MRRTTIQIEELSWLHVRDALSLETSVNIKMCKFDQVWNGPVYTGFTFQRFMDDIAVRMAL